MKNIPGMTVREHHRLCIGNLAMCYKHVPPDLQQAIREMCQAAKRMGLPIDPRNLDNPLADPTVATANN